MNAKFIILIMGRSGAGKSTYYNKYKDSFESHLYLNNDSVRQSSDNKDFSIQGRLNAAKEMTKRISNSENELVVVDMICPLKEMRKIISPHMIIWIDREFESFYKDTDKIFEPPTEEECEIFVKLFNSPTLTS